MKVTLWIPDDLATGFLAEGALSLEQRLALDLALHYYHLLGESQRTIRARAPAIRRAALPNDKSSAQALWITLETRSLAWSRS